jgi:hypothetical protein
VFEADVETIEVADDDASEYLEGYTSDDITE